jgi:hypothetical protein
VRGRSNPTPHKCAGGRRGKLAAAECERRARSPIAGSSTLSWVGDRGSQPRCDSAAASAPLPLASLPLHQHRASPANRHRPTRGEGGCHLATHGSPPPSSIRADSSSIRRRGSRGRGRSVRRPLELGFTLLRRGGSPHPAPSRWAVSASRSAVLTARGDERCRRPAPPPHPLEGGWPRRGWSSSASATRPLVLLACGGGAGYVGGKVTVGGDEMQRRENR